jgi:hypothetical protein
MSLAISCRDAGRKEDRTTLLTGLVRINGSHALRLVDEAGFRSGADNPSSCASCGLNRSLDPFLMTPLLIFIGVLWAIDQAARGDFVAAADIALSGVEPGGQDQEPTCVNSHRRRWSRTAIAPSSALVI